MFGRQSARVKQLEIELANQRRINAMLRQSESTPALRRIADQALQDALKLVDMLVAGEAITRRSVDGLISRRRFTYAMALLKLSGIVVGGSRGTPYRWRRMAYGQMIAVTKATHERVLLNENLLLQHMPGYVRDRVQALSPTGCH